MSNLFLQTGGYFTTKSATSNQSSQKLAAVDKACITIRPVSEMKIYYIYALFSDNVNFNK